MTWTLSRGLMETNDWKFPLHKTQMNWTGAPKNLKSFQMDPMAVNKSLDIKSTFSSPAPLVKEKKMKL